ncbi:hypothetical protein [Streptomyces xantholiticus]|uniref:hypothetical protein n=1 Tax=Streptomyces xantholiticus TaxID=68285 RepID=UPI001672A853|nr:hypothetical protein [Streptomyces xantholiticus]GGW60275.1 hypothetical protein GCM10010381_51870 [Streptomyces xantholiticus]
MATLHERQEYRMRIMKTLYAAMEANRSSVTGANLRDDLGIPEPDLATACTYLADEGMLLVDWTTHNSPATVTLTHQGIRLMEAEEEGRG